MLELLRLKAAAEFLGVEEATLKIWRSRNRGPTYYRLGDALNSPVAYSKKDLEEWLEIRHYKTLAHEKRQRLKARGEI